MAKISPKYFDRSPVSIRRATKFMRTPFDFCTKRYNIVQGVFCNMVQKEEERRLGRPRAYDPQVALQRALEEYVAARRAMITTALGGDRPLRAALRQTYEHMIDRFSAGESGARGCYLIGTAV